MGVIIFGREVEICGVGVAYHITMTEQWQELKETIIELRDNDGTATQQEVCKFLANLMDVLEGGKKKNTLDDLWRKIDEWKKEI